MKGYEIFSTTADVGITIRGKTYRDLYLNAVIGFHILATGEEENRQPERNPQYYPFEYQGDSCENVLVNLFSELIFLLYTRNRAVTTMKIRRAGKHVLKADLVSYPQEQTLPVEIKSVTYHNLNIKQNRGFKSASVVFDI